MAPRYSVAGDGEQLVALSHVDDVSAIIAAAIGNPKAHKQVFNCGTDKFISYKGLCEAIAKAANSTSSSRPGRSPLLNRWHSMNRHFP